MFASKTDMINRFGSKEVIALTDRDYTGAINDAVLTQGLAAADAELTGYLAGRYNLPFPSVPAVLVGYACDIARYRLTGTEVTCTDDIQTRYHQAVKYLTQVGRGEMTLGLDATGTVVGGVNPNGSAVKLSPGRRRFYTREFSDY
jgi:phage gp36-like protein